MPIRSSIYRCSAVLALSAVFAASALGQAPSSSAGMEQEIQDLRAENAAVREQLKTLVDTVNKLQQRLDGEPATVVHESTPPQTQPLTATQPVAQSAISTPAGKPAQTASIQTPAANAASNTQPPVTPVANTPGQQESVLPAPQTDGGRYRDGIIVAESSKEAKVPFLLKFNVNTQLRYLNSLDSKETFTDHLGGTRSVNTRNDITVNRAMFIFSGYIFDPRAQYSFTVWTSAGAASIVVAGNIGWQFGKALTLTAGYTGVPGSRSLVGTFPFFTSTDRSMADNFFRPGFTQGAWASGNLGKGLNYLLFLGNGLNTLNITANKIDTNLLTAGSVWWEPLGPYGPPGKSRNMYDDYFDSKKVRIRLGTSLTKSREDRFSDLDQTSPENTSIYNSDGVLAFSTGAFAPGVTLERATYKLWAIDGGIKWNGLAVNGQYFMRWLSQFEADGPLPLSETFDRGGELSAAYFVKPKKWMPYFRASWVRGQFGNSYEYGAGVKWHFVPTERLWFSTEVFRVNKAPYSGAFTPYTAGMTGWVPMVQAVIAF